MACDPQEIITDARCWLMRSTSERQAAMVQLLCDIAGGAGPGGGVTEIIAGSGITIDQGTGIVTVSALPTPPTGVSSIIAGAGISVNANTGDVTVTATGGGGGNTIYTADDSLVSNRTVECASKSLTFQNFTSLVYNSDSTGLVARSAQMAISGDGVNFYQISVLAQDVATGDVAGFLALADALGGTLTVSANVAMNFQSPKIINSTAVNGDVWTLIDAVTGRGDWASGSGGTTLYTGDGTLASNRTVLSGGNTLFLEAKTFEVCNDNSFVTAPYLFDLFSNVTSTNASWHLTAYSLDQVTKVADVFVGVNDAPAGFVKIYTTPDANVTYAGAEFGITAGYATIQASLKMNFQTPKVIATTAITGQFLKCINGATGETDFAGLDAIASTTAKASINIPSGVAPTSPVDGDMWYDGANLKFRVGGTTKTVTLI